MHRFLGILNLLLAALLIGILPLTAQDQDQETYSVIAGMSSGGIDVMAFGPAHLQVHRGDTVRWLLAGFHNIHVETEVTMLIVPFEQDGAELMQMNPDVMMPTIESGSTYTGGSVNSGLPLAGPAQAAPYFELTIDAEPGLYTYFCDVHMGMSGVIEVVADEVDIPSPSEALVAGFSELTTLVGSGFPIVGQANAAAANAMPESGAAITLGAGSGSVANYDFYPSVVVIHPGQSVTWTMSADVIPLPVGVSSVPPAMPPDQMITFVPPSEGHPPAVVLNDVYIQGTLASGSDIGLDDTWFSGMLSPGESYTLTFTEPGVYRFSDSGPGKLGAVIVLS
jgi:plastocyanin